MDSGVSRLSSEGGNYDDDLDVDAFFLPGGILDPDTTDELSLKDGSLSNSNVSLLFRQKKSDEQSEGATNSIPSNPWSPAPSIGSLNIPTEPSLSRWQESNLLVSSIQSDVAVMPPPGFEASARIPIPRTPTIDSWHSALHDGEDASIEHGSNEQVSNILPGGRATPMTDAAGDVSFRAERISDSSQSPIPPMQPAPQPHTAAIDQSSHLLSNHPSREHRGNVVIPTAARPVGRAIHTEVLPAINHKADKRLRKRHDRSKKLRIQELDRKEGLSLQEHHNKKQKNVTKVVEPKQDSRPASAALAFIWRWVVDPVLQLSRWAVELHTAVLLPTANYSIFIVQTAMHFVASCIYIAILALLEIAKLAVAELNLNFTDPAQLYPSSSTLVMYCAWYLNPTLCDTLLYYFNCPPFLPHVLSTVSIFCLSYPCFDGEKKSKLISRRGGHHSVVHVTATLEHRLCRLVLRSFRIAGLFSFLMEGIASPNSSAMMLESSVRLLIAYGLVLAKNGYILSPFTWFSGALQILLLTYIPRRRYVCDAMIVVVGWVSIQVVRRIRRDDF